MLVHEQFRKKNNRTTLLILSGGKAERLNGVNQGRPKSLVNIGKKTLLSELITRLEPFVQKIILSHHEPQDLFYQTLYNDLNDGVIEKISFNFDKFQLGTAIAVQVALQTESVAITIINGDTLFDNYENIIPINIPKDGVILSTSIQTLTRSSAISKKTENGRQIFVKEQERFGKKKAKTVVLNGVISIGEHVAKSFAKVPLEEQTSFEDAILNLQKLNKFTYSLKPSEAIFTDFGSPKEYLNAVTCFNDLLKGGKPAK